MEKITTYQANSEYLEKKTKYPWIKTMLLAFMGGMFIGLGYIGYFEIHAAFGHGNGVVEGLGKFIGASVFPVGLLLCVFLGGSLFTSDSMLSLAWLQKKVSITKMFGLIGVVFVFNFIGAFFMATIAHFANLFKKEMYETLMDTLGKKADLSWYATFFSAILCNIMVAGAIWMANGTKSQIAKVFLIWFPIMLFIVGGFQHVVANMFVFSQGLLEGAPKQDLGNLAINLIPAAIGNWVAGAVLIPGVYFTIEFVVNRKKAKANKIDKNAKTK